MSVIDVFSHKAANEHIGAQLQQLQHMRSLWSAVVLAALDDAIAENRKFRNGQAYIASWANSRDGREVLNNAGINPSPEVVSSLQAFVQRGIPTSRALARDSKN